MKTKTIIFISAAVVVLSTTLAFRTHTVEKSTVAKEEKVASSSNNGGFALEDRDQWK
ncbi:MAG TPA: hypothetical protein PKJ83_15160 [Cyclobacteriaceae bacterium]|nr:hypothetical protein [Cyclobacteriaceae bacterium]